MAELSTQSHQHPYTVNHTLPMPPHASALQSSLYDSGHHVPIYDTSSMGIVGQSHGHGSPFYSTQVNP
jgi:hypothetical protein